MTIKNYYIENKHVLVLMAKNIVRSMFFLHVRAPTQLIGDFSKIGLNCKPESP